MTDDHYETLGLKRDATATQIKKAYHKLAMSLHPDKCEFGVNLMKKVNSAYEILSDETRRRDYDSSSRSNERATSTPRQQHRTHTRQQSHSWSPPPRGGGGFGQSHRQRYSPGGGGGSYHNENDTNHKRFLCVICKEIAKKDHWESQCCRKLCCADCLGIDVPPPHTKKDRKICPNTSCQKPMTVRAGTLIDGWTRGSKVILKQLEAIAPTHECGRNVLPKDLTAHLLVCPELNTACYKCSATGKVKSAFGFVVCDACSGQKYLSGEWTKCFSCFGTGIHPITRRLCYHEKGCNGKGAVEGKWAECFRCEGTGSETITEEAQPGSLAFPYQATMKNDGTRTIVLQSITAMPKYADVSFEELRMEDYLAGNRGSRGSTSFGQASGTPFHSPGRKKVQRQIGCTVCEATGRLEGKWTVCFSCEGSGLTTENTSRFTCNSCSGTGRFEGFNLQPCHSCMGSGCEACGWKGSERCNCGSACKGHQSDL